jgi:hypothetical protein
VTALKRPSRIGLSRQPSTDLQQLSLAPALRGLGNALGASACPRLDFQRDLRQRLIDEARLIAAQPNRRPRSERPRRPKGGGIRLAAIGIGFSLAGGGIVAAAHSLTLPAERAATSPGSTPTVSPGNASPQARSRAALPDDPLRSESAFRASLVRPLAAPTSAPANSTASAAPLDIATGLAAATETPSAGASAIGHLAAGQLHASFPSGQSSPPVLMPSRVDPLPSPPASPPALDSPLP